MDRRQALAGLEWRTRSGPAAPSLAPRRRRPRDRADSLDTQSARVTGWRRRPRAVPRTTRPQAACGLAAFFFAPGKSGLQSRLLISLVVAQDVRYFLWREHCQSHRDCERCRELPARAARGNPCSTLRILSHRKVSSRIRYRYLLRRGSSR